MKKFPHEIEFDESPNVIQFCSTNLFTQSKLCLDLVNFVKTSHKKLSLSYKLRFFNPFIFSTQSHGLRFLKLNI